MRLRDYTFVIPFFVGYGGGVLFVSICLFPQNPRLRFTKIITKTEKECDCNRLINNRFSVFERYEKPEINTIEKRSSVEVEKTPKNPLILILIRR